MYRAYLKDAEYAANNQRAGSHYQLFTSSIAGGGQAELSLDPNVVRGATATPGAGV